jgi:hypothetical protein
MSSSISAVTESASQICATMSAFSPMSSFADSNFSNRASTSLVILVEQRDGILCLFRLGGRLAFLSRVLAWRRHRPFLLLVKSFLDVAPAPILRAERDGYRFVPPPRKIAGALLSWTHFPCVLRVTTA